MLGQRVSRWAVLVLAAALALGSSGCLAAAVGYGAYKYSEAKTESADKEAESRLVDSYTRYKVETDKTNLAREKAGMKPLPVQSYAEWKVNYKTPPAPKTAPVKGEVPKAGETKP
jgi:hypothetical protein